MHKNSHPMMVAAGVTAATAAVAAVGLAASKNSRKMKKVAKKVAHGAERAVLDLDKAVSRYYHC